MKEGSRSPALAGRLIIPPKFTPAHLKFQDKNMALLQKKLIRDYMKGKDSDKRYKLEKSFSKPFKKVLVTGCYCYEPVFLNASHCCDITGSTFDLLKKNNYKGEFRVADVTGLPYADKEFDCVFCCEVLEHLENLHAIKTAISEIMRVGKVWFISVPFENLIPHDSQKTIFDENMLKDLLPENSYIFVRKPFLYATNHKYGVYKA